MGRHSLNTFQLEGRALQVLGGAMQKRKLHSTRGGSSLGFELVQKSNDLSPCLPVLRISVRAKLQIRFPANSVQLLLRLYVCSFRQTPDHPGDWLLASQIKRCEVSQDSPFATGLQRHARTGTARRESGFP